MADFVVITGLSGAGRSTAADVLEDLGWFVIDNMPVSLMPKVAELALQPASETDRIAFVAGWNTVATELQEMIEGLRGVGSSVHTIFLDASTDILIRRYESTRRRHPASTGELLSAAIEQERRTLEPLRSVADVIIDTSELNVHELRDRILDLFGDDHRTPGMQVTLTSFGFKHGVPTDVDLVFDCRFLPNPHWVDELRPQTGMDVAVRDYVVESELAKAFLERLDGLLEVLLPAYQAEGKAYLTIAFGCTGGRHRSVAISEEMARRLKDHGPTPGVVHRDLVKAP
ncbi:MAG: RNase adapter RapZ [Acidimicrobiales bacterium]|nr:RNase adapter RapZ [Acidimicrobiales bacterium]